MAAINFYINTTGFAYDLAVGGSGLAFFGDSGFGQSVNVGSYQGTTYVSDGGGTIQGAQGKNIKWFDAGSGIIGSATSGVGLQNIPNYQSTLQIRFTHGTKVKAQNAEMRIYDRSSLNDAAVGVTTKVAEIIHTSPTVDAVSKYASLGSGDSEWITPAGSAIVVSFASSPGISGLYAANGTTFASTRPDTRHDWHAAISASPDSIGGKTGYGLYFSLEYL